MFEHLLKDKKEIEAWFEENEMDTPYFIHDDLSVSFYEHAYFNNIEMQALPFNINTVHQGLTLSGCGLVSLKGCPKVINGSFDCSINKLTSLEFCPEIIKGEFICNYNELTSLEFSPLEVGGRIDYRQNKLTSLEGMNIKKAETLTLAYNDLSSLKGICQHIKDSLDISNNNITSLEHIGFIGERLYCYKNPLNSLRGLPQKSIGLYHKHPSCMIEELKEFYYKQNGFYILQLESEQMQAYLDKHHLEQTFSEKIKSHQNYKL